MAPQRHVLRWVIIAVLVVVGIAALRQATMNQPDPPRAEEGTTVEPTAGRNGHARLDHRETAARLGDGAPEDGRAGELVTGAAHGPQQVW